MKKKYGTKLKKIEGTEEKRMETDDICDDENDENDEKMNTDDEIGGDRNIDDDFENFGDLEDLPYIKSGKQDG